MLVLGGRASDLGLVSDGPAVILLLPNGCCPWKCSSSCCCPPLLLGLGGFLWRAGSTDTGMGGSAGGEAKARGATGRAGLVGGRPAGCWLVWDDGDLEKQRSLHGKMPGRRDSLTSWGVQGSQGNCNDN